jgi:hypothetical protein
MGHYSRLSTHSSEVTKEPEFTKEWNVLIRRGYEGGDVGQGNQFLSASFISAPRRSGYFTLPTRPLLLPCLHAIPVCCLCKIYYFLEA